MARPRGSVIARGRATSTLGSNWTLNVQTLNILGNAAVSSAGNYAEASWIGQVFLADQWPRATIATVDGAAGVGVMVRLAGVGTDTGYLYFCSTATRAISKRVAGASTTPATAGSGCGVNNVVELNAVGSNLIALRNGAVDLTATDSVMVDAGAVTVQVGYRHNGSTTAFTPTLTPASVTGITDHVACANAGGTVITVEGHNVTCATQPTALSRQEISLRRWGEPRTGRASECLSP